MDKYKIDISKYICIFEILISVIILLLNIFNNNKLSLILTISVITIITIKYYMIIKFKLNSIKLKKMNIIADKIFIINEILSLAISNKNLLIVLILEIIHDVINILFFKKTKKVEIINTSKFKLLIYYIVIILNIINYYHTISTGFLYVLINLQILSIIRYIVYYIDYIKNKPKIEDNLMHKTIMEENFDNTDNYLDRTIVLDNLKDINEN